MKRLIVSNKQPIYGSHIYVHDEETKQLLCSDLFEFLTSAYKYVGGFHSFNDEDDFISRSYLWYITYIDEPPSDPSHIDINQVYTVSVYKQKYGLKLVGIGNNRFEHYPHDERVELKLQARDAMVQQLKFAVNHGWTEVSGKVEQLFRLYIPNKYIMDPEDLIHLKGFEDIEILDDHLHYCRKLSDGTEVVKLAYGHIE